MVGPLDLPFEGLAQTLIGTFSKVPKTFRRVVTDLNIFTNVEVSITDVAGILTTPPAPFDKGWAKSNFSGATVVSTDTMVVVSRLDADQAGYDMTLGTGVTMTVEILGKEIEVIGIANYGSGDLIAAFGLLLRA